MEYKSQNITCQNCKKDFTIEPDDFNFYEKIKVPPPTFCLECRLQRRMSFLNERTLHKRKCNNCSKNIITMFSHGDHENVFCTECYYDRNDCITYGIDFDFSNNFFKQFFSLYKKVPALHLAHKNNNAEGCEYANHVYHSKNVYLSYTVVTSEDMYYCKQGLGRNKMCMDSYNIKDSEKCYEGVDASRSYGSKFLVRSSRCIDSSFIFDCIECNHCFMSSNLRNKSYVFRNKQLSKEEYLIQIKKIDFGSFKIQKELKIEFTYMASNALCRPAMIRSIVNCSGDFLGYSKNSHYAFSTIDSENSKYIFFSTSAIRECYDLLYVGKSEYGYETVNAGSGNSYVYFSLGLGACYEARYNIYCDNCKNILGCVGLKNKQYCILNKQYTKEEYEELIPKIIKQMNNLPYIDKKGRVYKYGEFFPIELSPFAYNESLAYEEYPISKEKIFEEGYRWQNQEKKEYMPTIQINQIPDSIYDAGDDILKEIIPCFNKGKLETKCTFAFRVMPDELNFYRQMNIPLPRLCPNCRYFERKKFKLPWKLWHRKCMKQGCENEFETSYAPDRPEIVYCEKCYQAEMY